jgi:Outer membrane protein transport protein (OMPP1/FadL/TodX)
MKKIFLSSAALLLLISAASPQNVDDALRYSTIFYGGTARFMSMGGAFTALGGDMSTLTQNPAGIGVFRSSEISFSPQLFYNSTSANFNSNFKDYVYNFNLGQLGIVSHLISSSGSSGLINLNFGYSYNKTNNFNQTARIQGISSQNSLADYWADQSNGINYHDLTGAAGIAYDAWVIDTITGSGASGYGTVFNNYGDNVNSVYGQTIRRRINDQGSMGEHAITIGGNISNKIFFGATLGINTLRYIGHYEHLEQADYILDSGFKDFTYTDHYEDTGTGLSFKLGTIIRPIESLRIGLAIHTPTKYHINEYWYTNISSNFTGNVHHESSDEGRFKYTLTTPFRALVGLAVQIKKTALLSADYEFVDYSSAKFDHWGDNYDYTSTNDEIHNTLKPANNFRLGAEYRLDKLYLRGGYGFYGKAFRTGEDNQDLSYNSFSAGIGYREQNISVDFGYTNISNPQRYILYTSNEGSAISDLDIHRNYFSVTVGYKFGY